MVCGRWGHADESTRLGKQWARAANALRDTIGTLATLSFDIVKLFPLYHCYGGAPRGEGPASWDAPRLIRADQSRLANATTEIVRLSALRPPLQGDGRDHKDKTRAQQRAAGTKNTALFDIVNRDDGQRPALRAVTSHARVPGERSETPISGLPEIG